MKRQRPGIARAAASGRRPFRELLREAEELPCARDALVFAYLELESDARRQLIQAVLEEREGQSAALGAMLAVEPDHDVAQELAASLEQRGRNEVYAILEGGVEGGEARLVQRRFGFGTESLRVAWTHGTIKEIAIESPAEFRFEPLVGQTTPVAHVAETIAELLWPYLREGGQLPDGARRFARFFSIA